MSNRVYRERRKVHKPESIVVNGKRISLKDLPLVAYVLQCGHYGRDHAIVKGDLLFCSECSETVRVAKIVSD